MSGHALVAGEPVAIVGDVHGESERLASVLASQVIKGRRLIFVGDYIDRGPDSKGVLDLLVELQETCDRLVLLRGNHEVALIQWLRESESPSRFLANRGATTIRSYMPNPGPNVLEDFRREFPPDHLALLERTLAYAEAPDLLITHGGYNLGNLGSRAEEDLLGCSSWAELVSTVERPRDLVVVGHHVQPSAVPFDSPGLIGIDTGAGTFAEGPLTVLLLPEREFHAF